MSETTEANTGNQGEGQGDIPANQGNTTGLPEADIQAKNSALIAYFLMGIGLITGVFWLAGAIWAMVKKGDARGTKFEDHYSNIIRTFWWSFGWTIVGILTSIYIVGFIILIVIWFWSVYKVVKGAAKLTSDKAYKE